MVRKKDDVSCNIQQQKLNRFVDNGWTYVAMKKKTIQRTFDQRLFASSRWLHFEFWARTKVWISKTGCSFTNSSQPPNILHASFYIYKRISTNKSNSLYTNQRIECFQIELGSALSVDLHTAFKWLWKFILYMECTSHTRTSIQCSMLIRLKFTQSVYAPVQKKPSTIILFNRVWHTLYVKDWYAIHLNFTFIAHFSLSLSFSLYHI